MIDFSEFSSEVFQILRAYGKDIVLYDESGKRVFEPTEARRMYVIGDNILVSIVEDGDNSAVKLFLSPSLNLTQVQGFLETLRRLAAQSNLLFHVKKYNKEIKPKDFATQASVNEQKEISMNIMEGLYGTSKSSYLKMENARMIVRHSARIKEHVIGDRGRHIHSIFVENAQGERFLFPVNMLSGARAMTQHVNNGGNFADEVGSQIVRMAQDFRNLAQVTTHIKNERLGESAEVLRVAIMDAMKHTKRSFARMGDATTYVGESARVASNTNLLEGAETLGESIAALAEILGPNISESALLSVARNVTIEAEQLDEEFDDVLGESDQPTIRDDGWFSIGMDHQLGEEDRATYDATLGALGYKVDVDYEWSIAGGDDCPDGMIINSMKMRQDPQVMGIIGDLYGPGAYDTSDFDGDDEMDEGHSIDVTVEGQMTETPNNPQIRAFESWLESFDPDSMFGTQKVAEDEERFDTNATIRAAEKIQGLLDKYFHGYFDWNSARDGSVTFTQSGGAIEHDESNPHVLSPQNLSKVIGPIMDKFRAKQWTFTQPVSRQFTIGVPKGATVEAVQPVAEASGQWEVHGTIGLNNKFCKKFDSEEARQEWLDKHEHSGKFEVTELVDPHHAVTEGKSYKRNKDEDADEKKAKDQERKDASKNKKQPVEEGKSFKRNDDDEADVKDKRKEDKQKRDEKKKPVEEGKSFKRNDDDEGDVKAKRKEDKQKRDEKKQPVEEGKSFKRNDDDEDDVKAKRKEDKEKRDAKKQPVEEGKSFKRNDDDDVDADTKKKEDKQKRDEKKKQPVSENTLEEAPKSWAHLLPMAQKLGVAFEKSMSGTARVFDIKTGETLRTKRNIYWTQTTPEMLVKDVEEGRAEIAALSGGLSEDASQFSGSFETNINAEDGSVVSAKVTYVPNEAGAATILSVVRGDTGEDVLPFMDDDDIIHVEGLCADDIAQQGSERFATEATTIPRNPHDDFKNDVMTGGQDGDEQDPAYIARMKHLAGLK